MRIVCIALSFLLFSGSLCAQDVASNQARFAAKLFEKACFLTFALPDKVSNWAETALLLPVPDEFTKKAVSGPPSKSWSAKNALGDFVLIASPDGVCTVIAFKSDVSVLKEQFEKMLPATDTGWVSDKSIEKTEPVPGGCEYSVGYELSSPKAPFVISAILKTNTSESAQTQGRMSVTFRKKAQ